MISLEFLESESSPVIKNLRDESNYIFTRTLAKLLYKILVILSVLVFFFGLITLIFGSLDDATRYTATGLLGFVVAKLIYESFSVILDIGDASVSNLSKTNESKTSIDSSSFSSVVDELKKISEQNKKQTEALTKSIDELSDKTEKTNTYLHHIHSNLK